MFTPFNRLSCVSFVVPGVKHRYGCSPWWRRCSCHPACPPWCCRRWWWGQTGCWCCPRRPAAEHFIERNRRQKRKARTHIFVPPVVFLLTPWPSSWDAPYCSWTVCWNSGSVQWKRTSALSLAISKHFIWTADTLLLCFTGASFPFHFSSRWKEKEALMRNNQRSRDLIFTAVARLLYTSLITHWKVCTFAMECSSEVWTSDFSAWFLFRWLILIAVKTIALESTHNLPFNLNTEIELISSSPRQLYFHAGWVMNTLATGVTENCSFFSPPAERGTSTSNKRPPRADTQSEANSAMRKKVPMLWVYPDKNLTVLSVAKAAFVCTKTNMYFLVCKKRLQSVNTVMW